VLLRGGVDVNAKGRNTWTALLLALEGEHDQVADVMLGQPSIDLKAETPNGMTALMLAVWHQRPEPVRKLLQLHSDSNHQDKDGDAALHGAAWYGNTKIARMLLDAGANPNLKNKLGGTALMWAASYGQDEAVELLLERGADPRIKDIDGLTASGWAAKNGREKLVALLREAEKSKQKAVRSRQEWLDLGDQATKQNRQLAIGNAPGNRQLRFVHLQPRAVSRRVGRDY